MVSVRRLGRIKSSAAVMIEPLDEPVVMAPSQTVTTGPRRTFRRCTLRACRAVMCASSMVRPGNR